MKPCSHPVVLPRHQAIGSRTSLRDQCFLFAFVRIVAGLRDPCCLFAFVRIVVELRCSLGFGTTAVSGDS